MFKSKAVLASSILLLLCTLPGCNNSKPSINVHASQADGVTTICVKGTGYTPNGPVRLTMLMPPYTVNGQPGPNPLANPPFGNGTAFSGGTFQQILSLGGPGSSRGVCTGATSQPVLFLVDLTNSGVGANGIPPGFMCSNLPAPPPFGDQSACQ